MFPVPLEGDSGAITIRKTPGYRSPSFDYDYDGRSVREFSDGVYDTADCVYDGCFGREYSDVVYDVDLTNWFYLICTLHPEEYEQHAWHAAKRHGGGSMWTRSDS